MPDNAKILSLILMDPMIVDSKVELSQMRGFLTSSSTVHVDPNMLLPSMMACYILGKVNNRPFYSLFKH